MVVIFISVRPDLGILLKYTSSWVPQRLTPSASVGNLESVFPTSTSGYSYTGDWHRYLYWGLSTPGLYSQKNRGLNYSFQPLPVCVTLDSGLNSLALIS